MIEKTAIASLFILAMSIIPVGGVCSFYKTNLVQNYETKRFYFSRRGKNKKIITIS